MKKALFLDVDGTLISFKTHEVPASALAALREAHARGVRLFIATGRAAADLDELGEIPYDGVAALNGADCLMRDGRVVARHPISRSDFERAMQLADRYGFSLAFELNEGLFVNRLSPGAEEWARMVAHPMPVETNLYELFDNAECCQMCFFFDPETQRRVMAELPSLVATRWCPVFADINVRGVDQGDGHGRVRRAFRLCARRDDGLRRRRQRRGNAAGRRRGRGDGQRVRRGARRRGLHNGFGRRRRDSPCAGTFRGD